MKRAKGIVDGEEYHFASIDGESWLETSRAVDKDDFDTVNEWFNRKDGKITISMDTRYLLYTCPGLVIQNVPMIVKETTRR